MSSYQPLVTHVNLQKDFRGGERQTILLIEALAEKKIRQQLVVKYGSILHKKSKSIANIKVIAIGKPYFLSIAKIASCDLLHAHEAKAAQWAYWAKKRYGLPYVITRRVTHRPNSNIFTRSVYSQATCIIALSRAIREVLHSYQSDLPVKLIPDMFNPIASSQLRVTELREKYKGKYVIGHVGALVCDHKGQDVLIEAARKLVTRHPHMHFVFVGEGKDKAKLKEQAKHIDQVEFVGFKQQVDNYLAVFDIFAFPSQYEGLGSSLLDAMQHKLPIVASSVEGITDVIQDRVNGLLVPSRAVDELVNAIEKLHKSPQLAAQLGYQAYISSDRYSPQKLGDEVFSVYQGILTLRH